MNRFRPMPLFALPILLTLLLSACHSGDAPTSEAEPSSAASAPVESAPATPEPSTPEPAAAPTDEERLDGILAAQPDAVRARYPSRHPKETLEFFGVEPGMTVVEALPGGGWYSRILLPYLGEQGRLIGANYPVELFRQFEFATEEFLAGLAGWTEAFPAEASGWCEGDCADVAAYWMGALPDAFAGSADVVLYIRALHNMARFQNAGIDDFLDQAFADAYAVLKPGGVFGVVQHAAPESMPDDWASGEAGYLKPSFVIARAEAAGFVLEAESDINANPADQPTVDDIVWRLAPTLGTTEEGSEARAVIEAIGESNRMTLKFRKPEVGTTP